MKLLLGGRDFRSQKEEQEIFLGKRIDNLEGHVKLVRKKQS